MSTQLLIFAKAPVANEAKTRLMPALGASGAAALAERLLNHAVEQATAALPGSVELCVSPSTDHPSFARLQTQHGLRVSLQGDGDLGQRMARALASALADHPQVLLMGTDAPALDAAMLRNAAAALQHADAVFIPAMDGGYALVGLRQAAPTLFEHIDWSTPRVMAQTRERALAASLRWLELPAVHDIDEPADLQHLPAQLQVVA